MPVEYHFPVVLSIVFSCITLGAFTALMLGKRYYRRQYRRTLAVRELLNRCLASGALPDLPRKQILSIIREYNRVQDEVVIPPNFAAFMRLEIERRGTERAGSDSCAGATGFPHGGAGLLSLCAGQEVAAELIAAFERERFSIVRFQIAHTLVRLEATESIPHLVATLTTGPDWYVTAHRDSTPLRP
jgi:hypothetical protein